MVQCTQQHQARPCKQRGDVKPTDKYIKNPEPLPRDLEINVDAVANRTKACLNLPRLTYNEGICWFVANLVMMLFSDHMRPWTARYMERKYRSAPRLQKFVLLELARIMNNNPGEKPFSVSKLHRDMHVAMPKRFHTRDVIGGGMPIHFLMHFLSWLRIPHVHLWYNKSAGTYQLNVLNNLRFDMHWRRTLLSKAERRAEGFDDKNPIIIVVRTEKAPIRGSKPFTKRQVHTTSPNSDAELMYMGQRYVLDSANLHSARTQWPPERHTVSGITCGNKRYIYEDGRLIERDWAKKPYSTFRITRSNYSSYMYCLRRDYTTLLYVKAGG